MRQGASVIRFLGFTVLLSLAVTAYLVNKVVGLAAETVDPTLVALIGLAATPGSAALGALGAILATTGKGETPIEVVAPPGEPLAVEEVGG